MTNYTKATDFAEKDTKTSGDPDKVVKGVEIDDEFNLIEAAVSSKANTASPTFTGTVAVAALTASGAVTLSGAVTATIDGGTY